MGLQEHYSDRFHLDPSNPESLFLLLDNYQKYGSRGYKERRLWTLSESPDFVNTDYYGSPMMFGFVSIPLYTRLAGNAID